MFARNCRLVSAGYILYETYADTRRDSLQRMQQTNVACNAELHLQIVECSDPWTD